MTQTNEKAKALKHVREVCPELKELRPVWCCKYNSYNPKEQCDDCISQHELFIGHTPHLEHWLRGIDSIRTGDSYGSFSYDTGNECTFKLVDDDRPDVVMGYYNLTKDGDNQSPEFYQAYNKITS